MNLKSVLIIVSITLSVIGSNLIKADDATVSENKPPYLQHQSDFVQQVYSKVLIGFAFERKCSFLANSDQLEYEKQLNLTTEIFQAYLSVNKRVFGSVDASSYTKDMAFGAIRYAGASNCDTAAQNRVNVGFESAQDFMSIIDNALKEKIQ